MSLNTNGTWAAGVWAADIWDNCVWYEGICDVETGESGGWWYAFENEASYLKKIKKKQEVKQKYEDDELDKEIAKAYRKLERKEARDQRNQDNTAKDLKRIRLLAAKYK